VNLYSLRFDVIRGGEIGEPESSTENYGETGGRMGKHLPKGTQKGTTDSPFTCQEPVKRFRIFFRRWFC
jgi:hypothetical protein